VRILDADADLTGSEITKCTHQDPASGNGDRWCAFTRPGRVPDLVEIWVMNVTLAATGAVPPCDGTSPACLHLTSSAWPRAANAFDGDTLIYYSDPISAPNSEFVGPVFAWRPGWPQARQISSDKGVVCRGHRHVGVAACLDDPAETGAIRVSVELRAGFLDDATGGALPALGGRWPLRNDDSSAWKIDFSPDGEVFGVSNPENVGDIEALRVVATRDVSTSLPVDVLQDIQFWKVSNDGRKIYFFRHTPFGVNLISADFPAGTGVTIVESDVQDYWLLGERPVDQGVVLFKTLGETGTAFELLRDPTVPSSLLTVFTYNDVIDDWSVSADLRYTAWTDASFKGQVVRNSDLGACLLPGGRQLSIYKPVFLTHAALMFWTELSLDDPLRRDAFFATPERCAEKQRFGRGIDFYDALGDRGLVFGDEYDDASKTVTLKYARLSPDGPDWQATGAVRVHERVKTPITLVGSDPLLLVFQTSGDAGESTGTYVFGPVPF
jgi:hypothetical protein